MRREIRRRDRADAPTAVGERLRVGEVQPPGIRLVQIVIDTRTTEEGARVRIEHLVGPRDVVRHVEPIVEQDGLGGPGAARARPFFSEANARVERAAVLLDYTAPR